jgi:hypothetical protein
MRAYELQGATLAEYRSVPSFAFDPSDAWTETFQAGLRRAALRGRKVYEVGVGSGTNVVFMLQQCCASQVSGSDLDPRLTTLAEQLVTAAIPDLADRFHPIPGAVNLIDTQTAMEQVASSDVVVACLPQVPDPDDAMYAAFSITQLRNSQSSPPKAADHIAHYYPWASFNEFPFNSVGLGLNEALLRRVRAIAPSAEVVLNFGCRMGKENLLRLFRANGYQPEVLASCIVRQHEGTVISFYVALEAALRDTGFECELVCEFYTDPGGTVPISACKARDLLISDPSSALYHEVCVVRGLPTATPGHALSM